MISRHVNQKNKNMWISMTKAEGEPPVATPGNQNNTNKKGDVFLLK